MALPNPPATPFRPKGLSNPSAAPTGQVPSAVLTLAIQTVNLPASWSEGGALRVVADGGTGAAFTYGTSATLTIDNGEFIIANTSEIFELEKNITQISYIGASAAGKLRFHFGEGM